MQTQAWEWLFSGAGIAALGWLFKISADKRKQKLSAESAKPDAENSRQNSESLKPIVENHQQKTEINSGGNAVYAKGRGKAGIIKNSQVGVYGDNPHVEGGIHYGSETHVQGEKVQGTTIAKNIGTVIQHFGKEESRKTEALRTAYLNRVLEETGILPLQGIDPKALSCNMDKTDKACLNLSSVYTALLTQRSEDQENPDHMSSRGEAERKRISALEVLNRHRGVVLSALEVLNRHRRVVLLGDPGSGKSTFVNFLSMCMTGEGLKRGDINLALLTAPLPDDEGNDEEERQPWEHGFLLPVRVILRDFAARGLPQAGQDATADDLWHFIEKELEHAALKDFAAPLYEELQEKGGLVMLDGLDEVPEADSRRVQIKQVAESFIKTFHKCRVLVTSRTYAYQKQDWRISGLEEYVLARFSDGQIRRFADRWYSHIAEVRRSNREDSQGRAELLKRAVFNSKNLRELAQRPILLTLMASLHAWRGGSLPEKREELYADAVDLLLDRWESPKAVREADGRCLIMQPSLMEWLKIDRAKMRRMLNELGFNAHSGQKELSGTADIAESDLVNGLMSLTDNPEVRPRQLIAYLNHRAGLIVPRGVGVYSFPHRTFQEYLAACHLTKAGYPKKISELCRAEPDRWREVCLLAGAKAAAGSSFAVWGLAENLCHREPDDPKAGTADIWGAHIAGQVLLETSVLWDEISEPDLQKLERVKGWLLKIMEENLLPPVERVLAGNTLSRIGDPRFNPELFYLPKDDDLGFVKIEAGEFWMGSDKKRDEYASDDEFPQHRVTLSEYHMGRYPVTVAQFRAFVQDSGYTPEGEWEEDNEHDSHPVVNVSWHDAVKYCEWLTEKLGERGFKWQIQLPTEAQWEKAARGTDRRIYPWGDDPDPDRMNYGDTGINTTSPVGCFPKGKSPFGCFDMAGNVWEWCADDWHDNYDAAPADGRAWIDVPRGPSRVLRGGGWINNAGNCRSAYRIRYSPGFRLRSCGFRLVSPSGQQAGR